MIKNNTRQCVFAYIASYIEQHNHAPTYQQIADAIGLKSRSNVKRHVDVLIEMGCIKRKEKARNAMAIDIENIRIKLRGVNDER